CPALAARCRFHPASPGAPGRRGPYPGLRRQRDAAGGGLGGLARGSAARGGRTARGRRTQPRRKPPHCGRERRRTARGGGRGRGAGQRLEPRPGPRSRGARAAFRLDSQPRLQPRREPPRRRVLRRRDARVDALLAPAPGDPPAIHLRLSLAGRAKNLPRRNRHHRARGGRPLRARARGGIPPLKPQEKSPRLRGSPVRAAIAFLIAFACSRGVTGAADPRQQGRALYREGYEAFSEERWREAAEKMVCAQQAWTENPSTTRVYDRWFEPYVPLYYLGQALDRMGCRTEALATLDTSPLCQGDLPGREREHRSCQALI